MTSQVIDPSGFGLHQQQACWYTCEEGSPAAFKVVEHAGIADAQYLMSQAPKSAYKAESNRVIGSDNKPVFIKAKVHAALRCLDLREYDAWANTALQLKSAFGELAKPLWLEFSQSGRYDPREFWDSLEPRMSAQAGAGMLFAAARDAAVATVEQAKQLGRWEDEAKQALIYLRAYHRRAFDEIVGRSEA